MSPELMVAQTPLKSPSQGGCPSNLCAIAIGAVVKMATTASVVPKRYARFIVISVPSR
jgi:hypothetical protein